MNTNETGGNWDEQKGKLKEKFAILTAGKHIFEEGKNDEILAKLQINLSKTKEELRQIIDGL